MYTGFGCVLHIHRQKKIKAYVCNIFEEIDLNIEEKCAKCIDAFWLSK